MQHLCYCQRQAQGSEGVSHKSNLALDCNNTTALIPAADYEDEDHNDQSDGEMADYDDIDYVAPTAGRQLGSSEFWAPGSCAGNQLITTQKFQVFEGRASGYLIREFLDSAVLRDM